MGFYRLKSIHAASAEPEDPFAALKALLDPRLDDIVENFYAVLRADPEKNAVLSRVADGEALKRALKRHWRFALSRAPNEETRKNAARIGDAHARVELDPAAYIDAYAVLFKATAAVVLTKTPRESALVAALADSLFGDMGAALTSFFAGMEMTARERESCELVKNVETEMDVSNAMAQTQSDSLRAIVGGLDKVLTVLRNGVALVKDGTVTASDSIAAVAASVEELHASSQEVGRQANEANSLVGVAVEKADEAEQRFSRLAAAAARVTEIVGLIAGISNQTSLLALNASIEAARAGENGRGFAVVANEVKSLSQRTNNATHEISGQISEIETAAKAALGTVKDMREIIGRISDIAGAVALSSGQQIDAVQTIGESANSAANGAASLDCSVDMFTGASAEADDATKKVKTQAQQVSTLFERLSQRMTVTLRNFADADRRRFPRSPCRIAVEITLSGRSIAAEIVEISEGGVIVNGLAEKFPSGAQVDAVLKDIGRARARASGTSDFGQRLQFTEVPAPTAAELKKLMQRLFAKEEALRAIVIDKAQAISSLFEGALQAGKITEADLFDVNYVAIPDSNPQQYRNRALDFLDENLPPIQEPILNLDPAVVFSAAVDINGYLPVHNKKYSAPQGPDPVWNNANSRNRRIFDDLTGLMAARNTQKILSQTYPRDLGGGRMELIKDISAPIFVRGKHWGGLRMGAKIS